MNPLVGRGVRQLFSLLFEEKNDYGSRSSSFELQLSHRVRPRGLCIPTIICKIVYLSKILLPHLKQAFTSGILPFFGLLYIQSPSLISQEQNLHTHFFIHIQEAQTAFWGFDFGFLGGKLPTISFISFFAAMLLPAIPPMFDWNLEESS